MRCLRHENGNLKKNALNKIKNSGLAISGPRKKLAMPTSGFCNKRNKFGNIFIRKCKKYLLTILG
jgi:hypothetical protein